MTTDYLTDTIRPIDPLWGRRAPRELSDKEREQVHVEFFDSLDVRFVGELQDATTDAQALAFVRKWQQSLTDAEREELERVKRSW